MRENRFLTHSAQLGVGAALAHLTTLAVSPVLSRLYTPEEFGVFAVFNSLVILLCLASTGTFDYAIPMPKEDREAEGLARLALRWTRVFGIAALLGVGAAGLFTDGVGMFPYVAIVLVVPGVVVHNWLSVAMHWRIRQERFRRLSASRTGQALGAAVTQIGLGFLGLTSAGLLFGHIAGRLAGLWVLLKDRWSEWRKLREGGDAAESREIARLHREQPRYVLPSSLLASGSIELPILVISTLFSELLVGLYGFSYRMLTAPTVLAGYAIGNVYYQRISKSVQDRKPVMRITVGLWLGLFALGLAPFGAIGLYGEEMFSFLFGSQWREAGRIASILTPMLLLNFTLLPTSRSLMVLGKQKAMPVFSLFSMVLRLLALVLGARYADFDTALIAMVWGQVLVHALHTGYTIRSIRNYERGLSEP